MPATRTAVEFVGVRCPLAVLWLLLLFGCIADPVPVRNRSNALGSALRATRVENVTHARLREAYSNLPMSFEAKGRSTSE
jgi:hypothetical protein